LERTRRIISLRLAGEKTSMLVPSFKLPIPQEQQAQKLADRPHVVGDSRFHRWRNAQGLWMRQKLYHATYSATAAFRLSGFVLKAFTSRVKRRRCIRKLRLLRSTWLVQMCASSAWPVIGLGPSRSLFQGHRAAAGFFLRFMLARL